MVNRPTEMAFLMILGMLRLSPAIHLENGEIQDGRHKLMFNNKTYTWLLESHQLLVRIKLFWPSKHDFGRISSLIVYNKLQVSARY